MSLKSTKKKGVPADEVNGKEEMEKFHYSCFVCGLHFEEYEHVEKHLRCPTHAVKVWEYQSMGYQDPATFGGGYANPKRKIEWPEDLVCRVCDKQCNSLEQYELHVASKKHTNKEGILQETGTPYVDNKPPMRTMQRFGGPYGGPPGGPYGGPPMGYGGPMGGFGGGMYGGVNIYGGPPRGGRGGGRDWRRDRRGGGGGDRKRRFDGGGRGGGKRNSEDGGGDGGDGAQNGDGGDGGDQNGAPEAQAQQSEAAAAPVAAEGE